MTVGSENDATNVLRKSDLGVSQHHHYYRSSSKDSVIDKYCGKDREDVDRFLRAVQRRIDRNIEISKNYSREEQKADQVALTHRHFGSRVREYIHSLKGYWEEEPGRVKEARVSLPDVWSEFDQ